MHVTYLGVWKIIDTLVCMSMGGSACGASHPETKAGEAHLPHQWKGRSATPDYLHVTMT